MQSISDHLSDELGCEGLLECVHGLGELDRTIYFNLLDADGCHTVEEIADAVDRDRSTAYRAIRRLDDAGFLRKEQVNYENGGYCYRYEPVDAERVAEDLTRTIEDWHGRLLAQVEEFSTTYGGSESGARAIED